MCACDVWPHLAQHTVTWEGQVSAAKNLHVAQTVRNFLTSWETLNFSAGICYTELLNYIVGHVMIVVSCAETFFQCKPAFVPFRCFCHTCSLRTKRNQPNRYLQNKSKNKYSHTKNVWSGIRSDEAYRRPDNIKITTRRLSRHFDAIIVLSKNISA